MSNTDLTLRFPQMWAAGTRVGCGFVNPFELRQDKK